MATILIKKRDTTGAPSAGDLTNSASGAELAVNTADKRLYTKDSGGNVVELGTAPSTVDINAGSIDGTPIGANSASTGAFTSLSSNSTTTLNGTTIPASKTLLTSDDVGSTVQAYDADTAKYDAVTANFTGTLQNGGSNVLVDSDIGTNVQAYDADTAKYDDVTANFTGTLQNGGSNVLVDTDIGTNVQAYDADTAKYDDTTANFVGTLQNGGSNVLVDTDIGTNVQAYDAQLADVAGLTPADGNFIVGDGTNFVAESGSTARTSLGLGTIATQAADNVNIDGGAVDGITLGTNSAVTEAQIDNVNINGNAIVSSDTNGSLSLTPNGTGDLILDGLKWPQADGTADYVLKTDGSGQLSWTEQTGGGGTPGGSDTQIQYNSGGSFAGASGLVTDGSNLTINAQGDLRFADSDSSNWVAFQAPATVASNVTWTLPSADGTSGQVLSTNGSGTLSWASGGGGGSSISAGDSSVEVTDTGSDGTITFDTDGSERMRVTNTGDVIIGGTTELDARGGLTIAKANDYPDFNLFRDDNSIGANQSFGQIKWWAKDTTSGIPLAHAYIEASGSGIHAAGDNPTDLVFATTPDGTETVAEAGRITQSGAYVLKGGTTAPGGVGITFPATQSASSNANTLDDYEEGTWTPAWAFSTSGSATVVVQGSWYIKIGRLVTVQARFYTNTMTGVGNATVTGLPFTGSGTNPGSGSVGEFFRTATDFQDKGIIAVVSGTSITFQFGATTSNTTGLQASDLNTGGVQNIMGITITYQTTS